ncbi:hypothetical protein SLEP1_g19474 [Rubroshorea leprosula]|uniref:Transcriptional coactivator Hfi1/Transcriptional adapter 1 n=1 Tax=Rubroshorea leprosula TaxID=152421 RepID=A0AAV5J745_9ROSI|nr:hypothetical protein SLEP1_g19474 [Rubroshorea leprosula]
MQSQQGSRIDLGDLKAHIVKKIGADTSKKYFYYLSRFLSQKLSKSDFDRLCYRILGRENLPLHNRLIHSILKNAFLAKTPPPIHDAGPAKSLPQTAKSSPGREDGHEQAGSLIPSQNQNLPVWSNGVLPVSPRKLRSGVRKLKDRPSPLGPNGKVESVSHQAMGAEDNGNKMIGENGAMTPYDYQRPMQHLLSVVEQPEIEREGSVQQTEKQRLPSKDHPEGTDIQVGVEMEQINQFNLSRSPLLAPLGIPLCSASVGGSRKAMPVASSGDFVNFYDSGGLFDTETLRKRMEQIAAVQALGGVSMECANILNNMLDVYLKRLVRSCVELVGSRSNHEPRKYPAHKQQLQGKVVNGMWPNNHLHMQSNGGHVEVMQEQRPRCPISMLDFKVAMELNPQQLGEDWPLMMEKICMQSFEE